MNFMLDIKIDAPKEKIAYQERIVTWGSCFTEHIGFFLKELKFNVLQNPHGILFDPASVVTSLDACRLNTTYRQADLVFLNELWQSWQHHSVFSRTDANECLDALNGSREHAHGFLQKANWLILTLGSAFSYRLAENNRPVANCHRAPSTWFYKHLMSIEEITTGLENCFSALFGFNPELHIILTVSPVRHIRDGVTENNRSKARLIESVHDLVVKFDRIYYFPAYELIIDVLRDYRYYDIDLVHPNYMATQFVLEKFTESFIGPPAQKIMTALKEIRDAKKHRPSHPSTRAHQQFLLRYLEKVKEMKSKYPFLNLQEELEHFSNPGL